VWVAAGCGGVGRGGGCLVLCSLKKRTMIDGKYFFSCNSFKCTKDLCSFNSSFILNQQLYRSGEMLDLAERLYVVNFHIFWVNVM